MTRFDEIDLLQEPRPEEKPPIRRTPPRKRGTSDAPAGSEDAGGPRPASIFKRMLAFLTDLSLFAALALALSPLIAQSATPAIPPLTVRYGMAQFHGPHFPERVPRSLMK